MKILVLISMLMFLSSTHPIYMCLYLLFTIVFSCVVLWGYLNSFMLSFLIITLFVGGVLVLFFYTSAVKSNQISGPNYFSSMSVIFIIMMFLGEMHDMPLFKNLKSSVYSMIEIMAFSTLIILFVLLNLMEVLFNPRSPLKSNHYDKKKRQYMYKFSKVIVDLFSYSFNTFF